MVAPIVLACKASSKLSLALAQVAIAISAAKQRAKLRFLVVKKDVLNPNSLNFFFRHLIMPPF